MRSHTGDRPYKCQHCGDQFARSDLLSRHINKCHASEKPPTTTAPSRRKGTAAASRATTSKQACDQCVTSSLPCDGANPCTKCVQRKCRCTYVKFHRQTAPAGPGHPAPPTIPQNIPGRHAISLGAPRLPDEFLLAPPPGTMNLSSLYATGPAHQYPIQHPSLYAQDYASLPPLASALAHSESLASGMLPAHTREALENDPDAMARYRAQAELLTRAAIHNGNMGIAQPAPSADASGSLPGLYAAAGAQDGQYTRYNLPPPSQWDPPIAQNQYQQRQKEYEPQYGNRTQTHSVSPPYATGGEPSLQSHPPVASTSSSYEASAPSNYHHSNLPPAGTLYPPQHSQGHHSHHGHSRSEDLSGSGDDFGSDAGSTGTGPSHSIPSSTNSSSVHLPLPGFNHLRTKADFGSKDGYEQPRYPSEQGQSGQSQSQNPQEGEGGFSSAFGLMSLDDPNVLAGLANDGAPFFSGLTPNGASNNPTGLSLATPTQDLLAQLKSAGGREALESKEMRDFWKMYLRTPLTGPNAGGGLMFPLQTPTGPGVQLGHAMSSQGGRPSPSRRHSRVSSLPSMKTPPLFADERLGSVYNRGQEHYDSHGHASQSQGQQGGVTGAYNSTVRTTLHDAEDLKSYEQAVLARKAPMQLNLVPKRKGSTTTGPGPSANAMGKSKSMSPVVPHATYNGPSSSNAGQDMGSGSSRISELLNRPASSSSAGTTNSSGSGLSLPSNASTANTSQASSSLAHAFGGASSSERPSTSDGVPLSHSPPQQHLVEWGAPTYRPSFKRIASQTLGPDNAKRALLGPAGWDHDEEDEDDAVPEEEEEDEEPHPRMPMGAPGEGRRMSLPTQS
ncbi:uncharacterized protein TRAVEDRAFT_29876 [Trametes versicolor FP-101664 SS1]|uniref:uncharacterized protein n=1 Tax=Trametes versicolor (strain FP-101664) TaxID=717944 RepID=UPI0004623E5C|nr:uncharacterized protein TRAVEDRAFT_29876 [Trametes versicolor FP-101664 SS1]EIW58041.1 hypothetical protein TRAVEDRAFT_29876 [Trametes versicolor FP-101664 SS1]